MCASRIFMRSAKVPDTELVPEVGVEPTRF